MKNDFIQIRLTDGSLLVLTSEEAERARKRGDSVTHNRILKQKDLDSDILEAEEVK